MFLNGLVVPSLCWNGPSCRYLARGSCNFFHPTAEERLIIDEQDAAVDKVVNRMLQEQEAAGLEQEEAVLEAFNRRVASRMQNENMEKLFQLMDPTVQEADCIKLAEDEVLRRIGNSDKKECLEILQETVSRGEDRFNHLEENAITVMTKSYSFFMETIWTDFAIKKLSLEAFTKLAGSAKRAKISSWGCYPDSDDSDSENSNFGQLSCPTVQEDFKAILVWVEREDIDEEKRNLVLSVFTKNKALVLQWLKKKWERIGEETKRNRALGIPFSSEIPGLPWYTILQVNPRSL